MNTSTRPDNSIPKRRRWLRTVHRWLGIASALFVLLLSGTGIALNHSHDWRLDQRFVQWPFLLDAYGINAAPLQASFADGGHRMSLLGERLFYDGRLVAESVMQLRGFLSLDGLHLVATAQGIVLLTPEGELVERLDLTSVLPEEIDQLGEWRGRAVISSGREAYLGDAEVTRFERWGDAQEEGIRWSVASVPAEQEIALLQEQFRGRGLTVERLVADLHSGRIVQSAGPLLMDLIAVFLIILSVTGLMLWLRRSRRS
ncbi:MAG: hypothetical protein HKN57_09205 [Xanthomonadales bacterium]|nr:PepSY domain-containing protein [Gammaproteobacteria bacterium]MBT8054051.1 PepSY domain-containing protein [Gammaproteobacteria bacterium]NND57418.1 hypothetical protein [Xanthomonadales bacterium]NNK50347.1 hypothetical protein [Xanthomonadales bacterium]